jgi:hypothetical protein
MAVHYTRRGQTAEWIASMTNDTSYQSKIFLTSFDFHFLILNMKEYSSKHPL